VCEVNADSSLSFWGDCLGSVGPALLDACVDGDNSDCTGGANQGCACVVGKTDNCGNVFSSKGICASVSLTCGSDGKWPGSAACLAASQQEDCRTNLDENCDGTVNEPASCPCQSTPCQHGATCNPGSGKAYTCDCSGTGYEGTLCDVPRARVVAGPAGSSSCFVTGVSDAGTTVAAQCEIGESATRGHFWSASGGWVKALTPAGYPTVYLAGLSADGTKASGSLRDSNGTDSVAKWNSISSTATLLTDGKWISGFAISANANVVLGIEVNGTTWAWSGTSARQSYSTGGSSAAVSGDGKVVFSSSTNGFEIWTSPTTKSEVTIADSLIPRSVSFDGTTMIGIFVGDLTGIVRYRNGGISPLNSTSGCAPLNVNNDGRRSLGICSAGLYLWYDAAPSKVQDILSGTGSSVVLRTDVEGKLSPNGAYVALSHGTGGIVIVHVD